MRYSAILALIVLCGVVLRSAAQTEGRHSPDEKTEAVPYSEETRRTAQSLQSALMRTPASESLLIQWADFCLDRSRDLGIALRNSRRGEAVMERVTAEGHVAQDETRVSLLRNSTEKNPDQRGIFGELGTAELQLGMNSEAAQSLSEALRREPREASTLRLAALIAANGQRWADAESLLTTLGRQSQADLVKTLSTWPDFLAPDPELRGKLWNCLHSHTAHCDVHEVTEPRNGSTDVGQFYEEGRWEELLATPEAADRDSRATLQRGIAYARTEDCTRAIPSLERGLAADELAAGYWLEICYARAGEAVAAQLREMGDESAIHELQGDLLLRLSNDGAKAVWEYAEALRIRPRNARVLAKQADAWERTGNLPDARKAAQASLSIDPRGVFPLRLLALMEMEERNYPEAIERLKVLLRREPSNAWDKVEIGIAYSQTGRPAEVVRYLAPELRAGYSDPKGAYHTLLASALRRLGRQEEAQAVAAEASRLAHTALKPDTRDTETEQH